MKNSPLTTILVGGLAILVLGSVGLCWLYLHNRGELRTLQFQVQIQTARQPVVNALVADVLEYSKTHPQIDPILASVGIQTNKTTAPK
jgi:hypothetical protein